jgi:hypothetical protein
MALFGLNCTKMVLLICTILLVTILYALAESFVSDSTNTNLDADILFNATKHASERL